MASPKNYRQIEILFQKSSQDIRKYFSHLPELVKTVPYEASIGYLFSQIGFARKMILYCGIVKLHKVDVSLAWDAVHDAEITRNGFRKLYKSIIKETLPKSIANKIDRAEKIRDDMIQGKTVSEDKKRQAIADILKYAEELNDEVKNAAGFNPFGNLRGFKGRGKPLPKDTSLWVLKGMGFNVS